MLVTTPSFLATFTRMFHLLTAAASVGLALRTFPNKPAVSAATGNSATCVAFFEAWNRRDMSAAIDLFSEDVVYEDTVYPDVFETKEALRSHLLRVADALPDSFQFVVDDLSSGPADAASVGVRWHVESNGSPLPFTRGVSFYTFDDSGKINTGFDLVEPSLKPGDATLALLSVASKVLKLLGR